MLVRPERGQPTPLLPAREQALAVARRRRRTGLWLLFGLAGLATGAVWAAGVVTTDSTVGAATASPPLLVTPGAAGLSSRFEGVLTAGPADLAITFSGKKGVIASDAQMFDVNLTLDDPSTPAVDQFAGTYFTTIELTNDVSGTGWAQLSLELSADEGPCGVATDFTTATIKSVLHVETADSTVDLAGLTGGSQWCIGVEAIADASDVDGTFIRKTTGGSTPTQPTFAIYMAQSSL